MLATPSLGGLTGVISTLALLLYQASTGPSILVCGFAIIPSRSHDLTTPIQRHHHLIEATRLHSNTLRLTDTVHVYDNVVSPDVCEELHYLASEHAERCGVSSSIFYWKTDDNDNLLTPLEQSLCSILEQIMTEPQERYKNNSLIVEYWSRDEYLNMDTHADIDEQLLLNEGRIRCPAWGHVLYLDVQPNIRGPTCVFSQQNGWQTEPSSDDNDDSISMIAVPAVPGRLLQFPGSAMHAVPKPPSLWFLDKEGQANALADDDVDWEDDDYDDDEDDEQVERSVILFNVWENHGPGGVVEDMIEKGTLPEGIGVVDDDGGDDGDYMAKERERRKKEWNEEYGVDCCDLWCRARKDWNEIGIVDSSQDITSDDSTIRVPLMGNKARRLYPHKHVRLSSPLALATALEAETTPHHVVLREHGE